jgi:hypothetical protein
MYSSFKKHQLITETWRRFLKEGQEVSSDEAIELVQQALQDNPGLAKQFEKIEPNKLESILNAIAGAPVEDIDSLTEGSFSAEMDLDGDGIITPEESQAGAKRAMEDYLIPGVPASLASLAVFNVLSIASQIGDLGDVPTGVKLLASALAGVGTLKLVNILSSIAAQDLAVPARVPAKVPTAFPARHSPRFIRR